MSSGNKITAFVGLTVEGAYQAQAIEILKENNNILEIHVPTGEFSMLLKVAAETVESLDKTLDGMLEIPGVTNSTTFIVLKTPLDRSA